MKSIYTITVYRIFFTCVIKQVEIFAENAERAEGKPAVREGEDNN